MDRLATRKVDYEEDRQSEEFDYLSVDSLIKSIVDARVLSAAFELRLIDYLINHQPVFLADLKKGFKGDVQGYRYCSICSQPTMYLRNRMAKSN
jgi:hypothetical protein